MPALFILGRFHSTSQFPKIEPLNHLPRGQLASPCCKLLWKPCPCCGPHHRVFTPPLASCLHSESNLQLLFTLVRNAPEESVRCNCIIALGDLAFRFPNLVEPWTEHVYARLRDESVLVRKNTVMVLTHLILNDMMKVRFDSWSGGPALDGTFSKLLRFLFPSSSP
jgi:hypothetical protein